MTRQRNEGVPYVHPKRPHKRAHMAICGRRAEGAWVATHKKKYIGALGVL